MDVGIILTFVADVEVSFYLHFPWEDDYEILQREKLKIPKAYLLQQ